MQILTFEDAQLATALDACDDADFDELDFGLIVLDENQLVVWYNTAEAEATGFTAEHVVGKRFFEAIGPCMNNYLVADRFRSAVALDEELDEQLDYLFTVNLAPTPVRLRLMKNKGSSRSYLAVRFA